MRPQIVDAFGPRPPLQIIGAADDDEGERRRQPHRDHVGGDELAEPDAGSFREVQLELIGQDRVGIVQEISTALARHGVSIEKLHTETESASMSGETLFRAWADLRVPRDLDMELLKQGLEVLADELMVDINLENQPAN